MEVRTERARRIPRAWTGLFLILNQIASSHSFRPLENGMLAARTLLWFLASSAALASQLIAAEVTSPAHRVLAADRGHLVRFSPDGKPEWSFDIGSGIHHFQQLPNGNILTHQNWVKLIEISPNGEVVWSYDCAHNNGNAGRRIEVHTFQRLPDGRTMIVENGAGRIIEIDANGQLLHELKYQVSRPDVHRDVRQAHKLENGNYLVCHEGDGRVVEYSPSGEVKWDYEVPLFGKERRQGHGPEAWGNQVFNAVRLPGGNTLIATGNGHGVIEVTPDRNLIWELHQHDLPGITLAWTTSLEVLPNGNIVVGNCHAGKENPQLIEITRDKQVVWTFRDFDVLGNATAASGTADVAGVLR
jgi:hypothetical protein